MAITKVSSGVISANAVTATIVAENVITSSEIATDGVGTLQIANDAVTSAKLDTNIDIAGTLDVTGVLTADSNVVIAGNLTVNGSTVTNSSTNTTIEDALIELGTGTTGTPANDAGIIIERGDSNNAFIGFDESADKFIVATTTATGSSTGDLTLTAAPLVTGALTASGLAYPTSDGSANQVIKTDGSGNLSFVTAITDGAVVHNYTATGDGSTVTFDTGINPQDEVNTWVHIDGVYQNKSEYSYNGTSITFTSAPDSGAAIDIITGNQNGFSTADSVLGIYSATTTDTATYDTGLSASTENNVNIFIEGVYQPKSTYTWSGSTITFDANTPTGLALEVIASKTLTSGAVVTASITDSAVTTAKIADNAITSAKIVNNSITGADISATTNIVASTFTGALTGNVTGNVTGNLTGTIQTAAQTNITSLGTLTALTVDDITINGSTISDSGDLTIDTEADLTLTALSDIIHQTTSTNSSAGHHIFKSFNTEIMRIDGGNNRVGIGNNNPDTKLTVGTFGDTARAAAFNGGSILIDGGAASEIIIGDGNVAYMSIQTTDNATAMNIRNFSGNSDLVTIERATGNVGIGETNPDASLHITSNTPIISFDESDASQEYRIGSFGGSFALYDSTDSAYRLVVDGSGNVAIGSTSDALANMSGLFRILDSTGGDRTVAHFGAHNYGDTGKTFINIGTEYGDGTSRIGSFNDTGNSSVLVFDTHSTTSGQFTEQMRIKSDGQITTQGDIVPGADVIMANGRGISFAATANSSGSMSNELLDDYEEGTFTMQFHNNGTNPTVASVENTTAHYTKIGNTVRFMFYSGAINISNIGTGSARLTGLPFNSLGGSYSYSPVTFAHTTAFDSGPTGYTVTGSNYIQCTDALPATAGCQYVAGTKFIMVSGVYQTS